MANQQCNDEGLRELALFAGAGGGILGGKLLGWRTVCAVEYDAYAASVLVARQNDGCLEAFPVWDDVRTFDGKPWRGIVDVISGGFPCQDISVAGKGAGITGERSGLWSEMRRIIGEVRPRFVFVENSPALTFRGLGAVLGDLAALGYDARWGVLGAVDAGAPHKRERIWIVADASKDRIDRITRNNFITSREDRNRNDKSYGSGKIMANASQELQHGSGNTWNRRDEYTDGCTEMADAASERRGETRGFRCDEQTQRPSCGSEETPNADETRRKNKFFGISCEPEHSGTRIRGSWWLADPADTENAVESGMGRVAYGVASRVDRLACLGNGQVPAVAALAWRTLTDQL